jgi:Transcriptional regulator/sugar kinase
MREAYAVIDVGGTFVKSALASAGLPVKLTGIKLTPMPQKEDLPTLLGGFISLSQSLRKQAEKQNLNVSACIVSFPGPFDFVNGISLMRHKFEALYGIPLAPLFQTAFPDAKIAFLHDSTAYLLGQVALFGQVDTKDCACVMLGTGLGFSAMQNSRVQLSEDKRPAVKLWNTPYQTGIAEDAVSSRAIKARYAALPDVKAIALAARKGDLVARDAFRQTALHLAQILSPVLSGTQIKTVFIGGQIMKSAPLILPTLRKALPEITFLRARHLSDSALYGCALYASAGAENLTEVTDDA